MKTLILVRHSKAQDLAPGMIDAQRPLKESGLLDAAKLGVRLREASLVPQLIVASPAVRTLSTATILAGELRVPAQEIEPEPEIYEAECRDLLEVIQTLDNASACVLLVGHNPGISELASYLSKTPVAPLATSGVAILSFDIADWSAASKHSGNLA